MPVYKMVLTYRDTQDSLTWAYTCWHSYANLADAKTACNAWNTLYLNVAGSDVALVQVGIGDAAVYRNWTIYLAAAFTTQTGQGISPGLPDANGLLWSVQGSVVNQGSARYLFKGISIDYMTTASTYVVTAPDLVLFQAGCMLFFYQYRKNPTPVYGLPAVDPPDIWGNSSLSPTPYVRRVGRPFLHNGQTRRYRR